MDISIHGSGKGTSLPLHPSHCYSVISRPATQSTPAFRFISLTLFFLFVCSFPLNWASTTQCERECESSISFQIDSSALLCVAFKLAVCLFLCFFFSPSPQNLISPTHFIPIPAYPFFYEVTGQVSQNRTKSKSTTKQKRSKAEASSLRIYLQDLQLQLQRLSSPTATTTRYNTIRTTLGLYNTHHTPPPRCVPRTPVYSCICFASPCYCLACIVGSSPP